MAEGEHEYAQSLIDDMDPRIEALRKALEELVTGLEAIPPEALHTSGSAREEVRQIKATFRNATRPFGELKRALIEELLTRFPEDSGWPGYSVGREKMYDCIGDRSIPEGMETLASRLRAVYDATDRYAASRCRSAHIGIDLYADLCPDDLQPLVRQESFLERAIDDLEIDIGGTRCMATELQKLPDARDEEGKGPGRTP